MPSAVLVMDYQSDVVAMLGAEGPPLVERAAGVVAAARAAGVPVLHVVVGFRPGYPEMHPRNPMAARIAGGSRFVTTTPGADIVAPLRPTEREVVVVKHRVSAFAGTDLDMILRAGGVDTLVLLGIATSGVVLSTVRHAADADYRLVVVRDGCGDGDPEVHRVLVDKVVPRQATVIAASEVGAHLAA